MNNISANTASSSKKSNQMLLLLPFLKPYKKEVYLALLALGVTSLTILFFGKAVKYIIDVGFVERNQILLNFILLAFVIAVIIMAVAGYYRSYLINSASEKMIADIRKKVYDHLIRVSAEFFESNKTGDVISRLSVDTGVVVNLVSNTLPFLIRNSLLFIGGLIFLFTTSFKLSLISLILIFFAILPIIFLGKNVKNLSKKNQVALANLSAHIEESINGVKTIQSYLCEDKEVRNFFNFVEDGLKISLNKIRLKALMIAIVIAIAFLSVAVVVMLGSRDVINQKITSGDLSSFIFYSMICATSLVALSQIAGQIQNASAAISRIFELLEVKSPVSQTLVPQAFEDFKNSDNSVKINFVSVNFSYPSRKELLVLKNFNLQIPAGKKIAIVGLSGSGKSTIFQLLLRFYDVDSGIITLNDCDVKALSFADLRQNFSYISQDCFIFSGTIFENIAYVDKSITKQEVQEIIAENPALSFIDNLPNKIDSYVGEKGIKLSGGERQRIAIARAIIKDSPILLLDEATSALDNQNEQIINRVINGFAKNKTVITIAHKLSSVVNCDHIIFIKDGEIVEQGSHSQLIALGGYYNKMYQVEMIS
ncbi:MAG: Multidrug resistance transporter ATP-binding/permease protein BmrA [Pseudomonadota bacterium]|jgi:ATP-binding cassette subfamily B protein